MLTGMSKCYVADTELIVGSKDAGAIRDLVKAFRAHEARNTARGREL